MSDRKLTYEDGVAAERARCVVICEFWKRPSYISTHYGSIDEVGMKVLQKVIAEVEADILKGEQPN